MRILIAEDDPHLGQGVAELLALEGFQCQLARDGAEALALFQAQPPEFCILDVLMPGLDGLALCRQLRAQAPDLPILFLSARREEVDRVLGFDCGADDYLAKPFSPRELVARIRAIARRAAPRAEAEPDGRFTMLDLVVQPDALRAWRDGRAVDLSAREVRLLRALYQRPGLAVSRDQLFDLCWGRDYMPNSRSLDQFVSALRRKVERDPASPRIIRTVHGVGYRFDPGT